MNGIEALIAMRGGMEVVNENGHRYKMEGRKILRAPIADDEDNWIECPIRLNTWMNHVYSHAYYPLTFFEAMDALREGKRVKSGIFDELTYYLDESGKLVHSNGVEVIDGSFCIAEVKAKWTVVE